MYILEEIAGDWLVYSENGRSLFDVWHADHLDAIALAYHVPGVEKKLDGDYTVPFTRKYYTLIKKTLKELYG